MKTNIYIIEKILTYLRGDYNSVVYRFTTIPRERLTLFVYKLFGYSWIDYYSSRLNKFIVGNNRKLRDGMQGGDDVGFTFLKNRGLKPNHNFLDFGCGILKTGLKLIPFLDKGNYTGLDISNERLEVGKKELEKLGINKNDYTTFTNKDNSLREIEDGKIFDFIFLKSVVTHMPLNDFDILLKSFHKCTNEHSKIFFTFNLSKKKKKLGVKDFFYTFEEIELVCKKNGFIANLDKDWPNADKMVNLKKL